MFFAILQAYSFFVFSFAEGVGGTSLNARVTVMTIARVYHDRIRV
jgi:hypothetical protein